MDLNLISLFVEIVDSHSLSAAARKLGMTRSNISQRLKVLESKTGTQLLRRSTRSLELTQAGQTLYECGQRMLDDLAAARASMDGLGHTLQGRVRISIPTGFGRIFVGAMLLEFARAQPKIALTVSFNNRVDNLISSEVDVAVRITSTPPLDYVARHICTIDWRLYASVGYLEKHGPINCPADLERHTLIASPYPGRRVALKLTHKLDATDSQTVTLQPALQSSDYSFLADAVSHGIGVGLMPAYVSHAPTNHTTLSVLPDYHVVGQQDSLYIMTLPNRYPAPATQAVVDYLRDAIGSLSQAWM
ncbi:LysR family transcriptional regulator [Paraburkholderia sp. MM5477-R1]|uniref:LysR family transcriptional regulator n=1 Tax=Paraburkholderia sp. MM5477-R1 TaxID=2991062 RepID=UPI003D255268